MKPLFVYRIIHSNEMRNVLVSDGHGRECYTVHAEPADALENWALAFGPIPTDVLVHVPGEWSYDDAVSDLERRVRT